MSDMSALTWAIYDAINEALEPLGYELSRSISHRCTVWQSPRPGRRHLVEVTFAQRLEVSRTTGRKYPQQLDYAAPDLIERLIAYVKKAELIAERRHARLMTRLGL